MKNYFLDSSHVIANKRQRLDFATQSPTSLGALRSIRGEAVQRVHKNMRQMIESFLQMPENEADAPAWCPRAFRRCAVARANTARARWLRLASAYLKLDAARRSPSPSVSSNDAVSSSESSDDETWRKLARERETSPEDTQIVFASENSDQMVCFQIVFAFDPENSVHDYQWIIYSNSVCIR